MSEAIRREVSITINTRVYGTDNEPDGILLEATAEVFGNNTLEEAARKVREALPHAKIEAIDPAVEG